MADERAFLSVSLLDVRTTLLAAVRGKEREYPYV
jgi:hypothetical protein